MAVTAAPHGGLTRLRGNRAEKNYGQVSAGIEIDSSVIRHCLFNGNNKLIAPDHIQAGARRRLDSPRIRSQSFNFRLQRLVNIAQRFDIGLHCRKLLRRDLNFGARTHVHRHTNG